MRAASVLQSAFDRASAAAALLATAPLSALIALAVWVEDGAPVLFGQTRVGRGGRPFKLWKFRSMRSGSAGPQITASGDPRVTRVGLLLRRYKLDELPQLWNVLAGEMSVVGPRPEVPRFVDLDDPRWQRVLAVRPGITDLATLVFREEEALLSGSTETEEFYREAILPRKLAISLEYLGRRGFREDLKAAALYPICQLLPGQVLDLTLL